MITSTLRLVLFSSIFLAGCPSEPTEPAPEEAGTPEGEVLATEEVEHSTTSGDPTATEGMFEVVPTSIRFDGESKTVYVEAGLRYAKAMEDRTEPVYVGVTVVSTEGEEIDLMVQTLFPGHFDAPVLFTAGIEAEVQDVLIGAWNERVEPCEVDRYGCREFGFVLDGSLASWPEGLYTDGLRQRIPPGSVSIAVVGPTEQATAAGQAATKGVAGELAIFGVSADATVQDVAGMGVPTTAVVRYAHANDLLMARSIAASLKETLTLKAATVEQGPVETTFRVELAE